MEIDSDFKEFIQLLNEFNVKYLVIGGYAVNNNIADCKIWQMQKN